MRTTFKILSAVLLLTLCTAVSAQETFTEAYKAYNVERRARNYEAALEKANKVLEFAESADQKATAYTLIANSYNSLKKVDEAIKAMESAQALEGLTPGKAASVYWSKAGIYYVNKQFEKAREAYEKVVELEGTSGKLHVRSLIAIANTYTYSEPADLAKAREVLASVQKVEDANPSDKAEAIYSASLLDRLEKDYTAANEKITSILDTEGLSANVLAKYRMALGDNYRSAEQTDKAVSAYQALADDANSSAYIRSRALLMIGFTYTSANEYDKARKAYNTLIEMEDAYPSYVANAKRYLDRLKDK